MVIEKEYAEELTEKIQRLLKADSLTGAVVLLRSVDPAVAYEIVQNLPRTERKKLRDLWVATGEGQTGTAELLDMAEEEEEEAKKEELTESVPFYPDHFISEATSMVWIVALISVLTIFLPAGLESKANPLVTPTGVKPEWYFLFLFAFLHYVPVIIGVLAPIVGGALLVMLPFLDRNPEIKLSKRKIAIASLAVILTVIVILSFIGYLKD
ncbi:MAG: hypothetical protein WA148_01590 [Actinomycetota bacterium]